MTSALLTRYILASVWTRILIFITLYFIIRELHFIDMGLDFEYAECMPRKKNGSIIVPYYCKPYIYPPIWNDFPLNSYYIRNPEIRIELERLKDEIIATHKYVEGPLSRATDFDRENLTKLIETFKQIYNREHLRNVDVSSEIQSQSKIESGIKEEKKISYTIAAESKDAERKENAYRAFFKDKYAGTIREELELCLSGSTGRCPSTLDRDKKIIILRSLLNEKAKEVDLTYKGNREGADSFIADEKTPNFGYKKVPQLPSRKNIEQSDATNLTQISTVKATTLEAKQDALITVSSEPKAITTLASDKTSNFAEKTPEYIKEFVNSKLAEKEIQINTKLSDIEKQQKPFVTHEFLEQLKSILLNKQEQIQEELQGSIINSTMQQLITQTEITNLKESSEQQISMLRAETKASIAETYSKTFREQIDLRIAFDEKLNHTNNKILSLKNQNEEVQKTVINQIAEAKNQQELIENVRKSFERKLNARNLLINQLQEEKTQLVRNVTDLQQKNEQLANHVNRLERTFDRDIQSLHRAVDRLLSERNTAKIDDIHTMGLPPASPKSF